MPEAVRIRVASLGDAPAIGRLSAILGYPEDAAIVRDRLARLLPAPDHAVFVAESPSVGVVAWLHAAVLDLLDSGRRGEILGLVVDPAHRRGGAGRELVATAERWAVAHGLERMAVRSNVARLESHPFYERLGYSRIKTQHSYRKQLSGPSS